MDAEVEGAAALDGTEPGSAAAFLLPDAADYDFAVGMGG